VLKKLFSRRSADDEFDLENSSDRPAAPRDPGGLSLTRLNMAAFLLAAVLVAVLAFLAHREFVNQVGVLQQQALAAQGERLAAELSGRVRSLTEVVEKAAAEQGLRDAMAAGDAAALASRADAMASAIPGALRVRFLPLNTTTPDESATPRLGYAALDLARQAEQGLRPPVEVHWYGAPDQHVAVVRAIAAPQQPVAGVLVANIELKQLHAWMQAAVPAGGYAELRQGTGESYVVLSSQGEVALQGTPATANLKVPGTTWDLFYWLPAQNGALSMQAQIMFVAPFAVAIALLLLIFLMLGATATRLVRSDLVMLGNHVVDLMSRKRDHGYTVRLREFRKAVQTLDETVQPLMRTEAPQAKAGNLMPEDPLFLQGEQAIAVEEVADPKGNHNA